MSDTWRDHPPSLLSAAQSAHFRSRGWLLLPRSSGLLSSARLAVAAAQVDAFHEEAGAHLPPLPHGGDLRAAIEAQDSGAAASIMEARIAAEPTQRFPMAKEQLSELNLLSLDPQLLSTAAELLYGRANSDYDAHDLRLAQSALVCEYGDMSTASNEQRADFVDPSLVPTVCGSPDALQLIIYLCDEHHEAGTVLIVKADTYSAAAAAPIDCPPKFGSRKVTQQILLRKNGAQWVSSDAPIRSLSGHGELLGMLSPLQRSALGFPKPGHPYWRDPSALALAVARYPAWDPAPYVACTGGAPVDFQTQFDAGASWPDASVLPDRVFEKPKSLPRLCPPEPAAGSAGRVLSEAQVAHWREVGYLHIHGIWPQDVIDAAYEEAVQLAPFPNPDGSQPSSGRPVFGFQPPTRAGHRVHRSTTVRPGAFPYSENPALATVTLHPRMLQAISELLDVDVPDLRLTQSMLGGKYGGVPLDPSEYRETFQRGPDGVSPGWGNARGDQGMHHDFGNNTVLFPARNARHWGQPEEVQSILYYGDYDGPDSNAAGGGTAFVGGLGHTLDSRLIAGGGGADYMEKQGLYPVERQVAYKRGSVFLYSLGTWHRGTPVEPHGIRRIQFNCYRVKTADWVGGDNSVGSPSAKALSELGQLENFDTGAFLSNLSAEQRCIMGFPAPGDPYWTQETLETTAKRYPAMDMRPYVSALVGPRMRARV